MDNVFQKACLIQLSSSVWQGSRMIDSSIMSKLGQGNEWLKGKKFLVNPELLGPFRTVILQSRAFVQRYALPFPITSIYLIPKESLAMIDEGLQSYKEKLWDKVNEFESMYYSAREEAKIILGDLFNDSDYPIDIRTKFNFEWRFFTLDLPGKSSILSPEIYEREKQKFIQMMTETRELASTALAEEFGEVVQNLVERLSANGNKPKALNSSMFNKLHEFLEEFETKNLFDDERLRGLTKQARTVVNGVSAYNLKYNGGLREQIKKQMSNLKTAIDEAIVDIPRRKLQLAA